jgi:hypothetical protein
MHSIFYSLSAARRALAGCVTLLGLAATPAVQAQTILGLGTITGPNSRNAPVGSQGLILIDPNNGSTQNLVPVAITGITAGQTLIGMDYRPVDNQLYALGYDATTTGNNTQLYILDPGRSQVFPVGSPQRFELGGPNDKIGFDFNPTVDRIRVVSTNNANLRLIPTTGALAANDGSLRYASGTPADPGVNAVAYTNPFLGSTGTTLYDFDIQNNGLLSIQSPPNDGVLTSPVRVMLQGPSGNFGIGARQYSAR